ncbi:MAG: helix-turn-helix domain-containing protein [Dactylosporangium sp.]|nr:helix-turn-helix domain-containing protein [Dactylosporangium sp.]
MTQRPAHFNIENLAFLLTWLPDKLGSLLCRAWCNKIFEEARLPAKKKGPTLRAQWLGQQLRELREDAGFNLRQASEYIQRDPSMLSRFEAAEYPIRRPEVLALLDFYGVSDSERRKGLLTLAEDVWQKGWWDGYARDLQDRSFVDFVWLETRARQIRSFDNTVFPGLFQTRAFAEAVISAADPDASASEIDQWVELRMARQRTALTSATPPQLAAILDESLLRRLVGGNEVMRGQLRALLELAERPHIEIRVLPFSAGTPAPPYGAFKVFSMVEPYPDVAYTETLAGAIYVEEPGVDRFAAAYDRLYEATLDASTSAELISAAAKELS